jgi:hypothetical protein
MNTKTSDILKALEQLCRDNRSLQDIHTAITRYREIAELEETPLEAPQQALLQFMFKSPESVSGRSIQQHLRFEAGVCDYHIDALLKRKFIAQTRLGGDSASCWFSITGEGRDFIMKGRA